MSTSQPSSKSALLTLPTELIESILISLAPSCVSLSASLPLSSEDLTLRPAHTLLLAHTLHALTLTCKKLHHVLSAPPDGHLWREIYLGVWDDPRRALSIRPGRANTSPADIPYNWEDDFKSRILAVSYLLSRTSPSPSSHPTAPSRPALTSALTALLRALHTAHPIPPSLASSSGNAAASLASWANFTPPPPPAQAPNQPTGSGAKGDGKIEWPLESRNVDWVRGVLEHGWPAEVGWRLVGGDAVQFEQEGQEKAEEGDNDGREEKGKGKQKGVVAKNGKEKEKGKGKARARRPETRSRSGVFDREFDESEMGQTFWRLVAYTGFIPVAPPPKVVFPSAHTSTSQASASHPLSSDSSEPQASSSHAQPASSLPPQVASSSPPQHASSPPLPNTADEANSDNEMPSLMSVSDSDDSEYGSSEAQSSRARRLARMRVYNLQYLRRERRWGPYLPVSSSSVGKGKEKESAEGGGEGGEGSGVGGREEGEEGGGSTRRRGGRRERQPVMFLRSEEGEGGERVLVLDTGAERDDEDGDWEDYDGDEEEGVEEGAEDGAGTEGKAEIEGGGGGGGGGGGHEHEHGRVTVRVRIAGTDGEDEFIELEGEVGDLDEDEGEGEGEVQDEGGGEGEVANTQNSPDRDNDDEESSDHSWHPLDSSDDSDDPDALGVPSFLPLLNLSPTPPPSRQPASLPRPRDMRPDWAYLAGVRLVVEANLREAVGEVVVRGLGEVGGVRGRVVKPYHESKEREGKEGEKAEEGKGKEGEEKERVEGECDGWDWAGVEGAWRRCVCWMDYRDLILNNLHAPATRYSSPTLQEAMRIIPLQLHIERYTRNEEFPDRPDIHVEGQAAGPDHTMRRVWGVVGMIGSGEEGEVRWNLIHCRRDGDQWQDEWAMEGVQVGGEGSAMGVLGMWTGAGHERTDPLGPSWMWKVMA
ncbi:hypothetical protein OE88DRAFT_1739579 [Heliocybe sulcata]|uniref:F-box domain-containing protein n=1 Tax=Heliocybe sulcata TaxID=5364 RepID=A0A5C3MNC7_9AGAM|nr:hypothetical protein OE88DRAFT_1739579 [Heliocybe sulcata]